MAKRRIKHHPIVGILAQRLSEERGKAHITQQGLAAQAKLSVSYVARLERAEAAAGVDVLAQLAEALGVSPGELLSAQIEPGLNLNAIKARLKTKRAKLSKCEDAAALQAATLVLGLIDKALEG